MVQYKIDGHIAVILGCSKGDKDIEIPSTLENVPVGKIEEYAFAEVESLRRIVIPRSVRVIGQYAFAGCKNLSEVIFQEGCETIEDWAFISCKIEHISLPNTIKKIGPNAFLGCAVKSNIDEYMKNKFANREGGPTHSGICGNSMAIFPIDLWNNLEGITTKNIMEKNRHFTKQIVDLENQLTSYDSIDIPYAFDEDQFIIAIKSNKELKNFRIDLTLETQKFIGLYKADDPDFVNIKFNVYAGEELLGDQTVKTPYVDNASFEVLESVELSSADEYRYYLLVQANLDCFGTGNLDRQFAMNHFDHLIGKYFTELQYNIIPEEVYNDIKARIDAEAFDTLKEFLTQIQGAPALDFTQRLYAAVYDDEGSYGDLSGLHDYCDGKLMEVYVTLSDYKSFENYCFDCKEAQDLLSSFTGLSIPELSNKYQVFNSDMEGNYIDDKYLAEFRKVFADNEVNFNLHTDFLSYIYQSMQALNKAALNEVYPYLLKQDEEEIIYEEEQ